MKERKAFFKKNKGLMKRLFSFVLAVALVLNMGQIMPGSTVNAAEASGTHVTLHFNNSAWGWGAPAIQYWGGTSTTVTGFEAGPTEIANWGGAQGYTLTEEENGWYSITLKGDFEGFQFLDMSNSNNNTGGKGFHSYMTQYAGETAQDLYYREIDGRWYLDAAYETELQAPADAELYDVTIHYNNTNNWTGVSLYAWTGAGTLTAGWTGDAATANTEKDGWYDYTFTGLTTSSFNFIWNGSGGQTDDLTASLSAGDNEIWVEGNLVVYEAPESWTGTEGDDNTGDDTTDDGNTGDDATQTVTGTYVKLYFNNNNWNWTAPAIQYWGGTTTVATGYAEGPTEITGWGGAQGYTLTAEADGWYSITLHGDFEGFQFLDMSNPNNNTGGKGYNSYMAQYDGETAQSLYYKESDGTWYLDAAYETALQAPADAV
ncbi:MAG: starch-binding protein, partial [Lachnospiraceae bacterium]|nr:starch-binding protein [Lachnospiraceae bacterium]